MGKYKDKELAKVVDKLKDRVATAIISTQAEVVKAPKHDPHDTTKLMIDFINVLEFNHIMLIVAMAQTKMNMGLKYAKEKNDEATIEDVRLALRELVDSCISDFTGNLRVAIEGAALLEGFPDLFDSATNAALRKELLEQVNGT